MSSGQRTPPQASSTTLSLHAAQAALATAHADASSRAVMVTAAVVDAGGHLLAFGRMDGVHLGTIDVAIAKARTAAYFRKPTRIFAQSVANGMHNLLSIPNLLPVDGGIPVFRDGYLCGAIGVSGASSDVDHLIAQATVTALEASDA